MSKEKEVLPNEDDEGKFEDDYNRFVEAFLGLTDEEKEEFFKSEETGNGAEEE